MFLSVYYEDSKGYDAVRSATKMAVNTCSKALSAHYRRHGKSPCFSEVTFLESVGPDYPILVLPLADGREFLECAF